MGLSVEECWRWTKERFGLSEPLAALIARYDRAVLELLAGPIVPLPGARELVERLRALGVPLAVASSSRRGWVEAVLRGLGLEIRIERKDRLSVPAYRGSFQFRYAKPAP